MSPCSPDQLFHIILLLLGLEAVTPNHFDDDRVGDHVCQREMLGTFERVSEIYTNIYHLYMGYTMVVQGNMG